MLGFAKATPVTLYAFTSIPALATLFPPIDLIKCLPEWWRNLEPYATLPPQDGLVRAKIETIKHCYALQELFKRGIGMRLWHDAYITIEADGTVLSVGPNLRIGRSSDPHTSMQLPKTPGEPHQLIQFPRAFDACAQHFKFHSPWLFVCESPVHFIWSHPIYHQRDPFRFQTMPGLVEYRHQHATEINILLRRVPDQRVEFSFAAGEMIAYLLPTTDKSIRVVAEEVSPAEMDRLNYAAKHFTFKPILFNRRHRLSPYLPSFVRRR